MRSSLKLKSPSLSPLDIGGDAGPDAYRAALDALLQDAESDALLVMYVPTAIAPPLAIAEIVAQAVARGQANDRRKPVLAALIGADNEASQRLTASGVPNFETEDDAIRAFMYGVHHREALQMLMMTPPSVPSPVAQQKLKARQITERAAKEGRKWLDPVDVADILTAYGIPAVPTHAAANAEEAIGVARNYFAKGQAVAVKLRSPDIVHKSDVGGVALGLADADAVRNACDRIVARVSAAVPAARLNGFVVQPMIVRNDARELIAGIADDPTFGPVILFGRGGIAVEITRDRALALPPLDLILANELISRTAVARELQAYRDVAAVKAGAVPSVLVALSQMAADLPLLGEMDVNPLLADADGVLALDARMAVMKPRRLFAGETRLAIRPYPAGWQRRVTLRDGTVVEIRPLKPEDEPGIAAFLARTSSDDLYSRFLGAVKTQTHAFIARLTQLDYARAMAFAALAADGGAVLGVARLHSDAAYRSAEYAILVRTDMKGCGLGWALMTELIRYAASEGLVELHGDVLTANADMLQMCRALGFTVAVDPDDPTLSRVSLAVGNGPDDHPHAAQPDGVENVLS